MEKIEEIKYFFIQYWKKILFFFVLLLFFILIVLAFVFKKNWHFKKKNETLTQEFAILEDPKEEIEPEKIEYYFVDIKGYVNNPGVYSLEKGKRVVDAINQAGGLKKEANTTFLNLSLLLRDQMVIIVYSNQEIKDYSKIKEQENIQSSICNQEIKNDACIVNNKDISLIENITEENQSLASEKININTASVELLMTLSKIGESKALAIVEYRNKNGKFKTIDDIKNVSGIGDSIFEAIKAYITI